MYPKSSKSKSPKGSVRIKVSNGRLQLVFSHSGRRHYLSLGLPDSKLNRKAAEAKAKVIEADIAFERFDPTLAKYKPQTAINTFTPISTPKVSFTDLWEKYTKYKAPQVSASTLTRDYGKIAKRLKLMPKSIKDGVSARDWLLNKYSSEVARRTLVQLNACFKWAVRSDLIEENFFEGMARDIKKTVRDSSREPFSSGERDAIIAALENNTYSSKYSPFSHSYYAPYVNFLFMTGCRPEEAVALQWKHITIDCTKINFIEAIPCDTGIRGATKNKKTRIFPCNPKLQSFLQRIKPEKLLPDLLVFPSPRGQILDTHNFSNRIWKPVIEALVKEQKLEKYLPQYNTRHTFITLALEHGLDAKDVARLLTSPMV